MDYNYEFIAGGSTEIDSTAIHLELITFNQPNRLSFDKNSPAVI